MSKVRGLRRKCRNMVWRIEEETKVLPRQHLGFDYWHLHLPIARTLLDSRSARFKVRRLCVQTLINRAHFLARMAPEGEDVRVVVAVTMPQLWSSQIIVFFGPSYFKGFFDRNGDGQKWTLRRGSLCAWWNLQLPANFSERGYKEEIRDENFIRKGEIWFFGELEER